MITVLMFFSEDFAKSQIAGGKKQGAQIIIVSMRWGTEFWGQVNELQRKDASFWQRKE